MTEKDWEEYFYNRQKNDRPISKEQEQNIYEILLELGTSTEDNEKRVCLFQSFPVTPEGALAAKKHAGLKYVSNWNLYYAKEKYPYEF